MSDFRGKRAEMGVYDDAMVENGYTDEIGGFHYCGVGINPLGKFCGECTNYTCKGCIHAFVKDGYVLCSQCIYFDECKDTERVDGCYVGDTEENI